MKNDDLTNKILKRIVKFEKKRVTFWIVKNISLFVFFSLVTVFFVWVLVIALDVTRSDRLLLIFFQDPEVVKLYWKEVLATVFQEVPTEFFVAIFVSFLLTISVIIISLVNVRKIKRKITSIKKYLKK